MRDDFDLKTKDTLASRVGYRCSNPGCRQPTGRPRYAPRRYTVALLRQWKQSHRRAH